MVLLSGAGSLAAAATRLRRAGRLPALDTGLPPALVGDRLAPLVLAADPADELETALVRLAAAREAGQAQDAPEGGVSRAAPGAVGRARGASRPPSAAEMGSDERRSSVLAPGPVRLARQDSADSARHSRAPAMPVAASASGARSETLFAAPGGHAPGAAPAAAVDLAQARDTAARSGLRLPPSQPVRVAADPRTAALLAALVTGRDDLHRAAPAGAPSKTPRPGARSPRTARTAWRAGADQAIGATAPRTAGPTDAAPAITPGVELARPVDSAATPRPMPLPAIPAAELAQRTAFLPPPTGLAGLAGWWQAQSEPAQSEPDQAELSPAWSAEQGNAGGDRFGRDVVGPGGFEPWEAPAPAAERLREALEQLLLEEALADGLEVSDGPA